MNLVDELRGLVAEFEADGAHYALCGGLAVAAHGHPRFTKDIDVLVPKQELARVRAAARRRGFILEGGRLTPGAGTERERELFRISKAEGANVLTLDLLLVGPTYERAWDGRVRATWRGRELWLVSRDGLIWMKTIAGRPQDLADIDALKRMQSEDPHG